MDRYRTISGGILLALAACLLTGAVQQHHRAILALNRGAAAPALCNLLVDNMENADGTNATVHGWIADGTDPADEMEIDTAQAQAGTSSLFKGDDLSASARQIYKTITPQATGKWWVSFWYYRTTATGSNNQNLVQLSAGSLANFALTIRSIGANLEYDTTGAGAFVTICTGCIIAATWARIEIEMNQDANTWTAWVNSTQQSTNVAFVNAVDPDRFYIRKGTSGATNTNSWVDTVCITDGPRS